MLDFASPGQLPDQPPGGFPPNDVASFEELVDDAGEIFNTCIRARGAGILPDLHFGWVRAGESVFSFSFSFFIMSSYWTWA